MTNKSSTRRRGGLLFGASGMLLAVTLALLPAAAAHAAYSVQLGGNSCAASTGFIRSNAKGSNVAHSVNNVTRAIWNNGAFYYTRTSSNQPVWSSSRAFGNENPSEWTAVLNWAQKGCGGL